MRGRTGILVALSALMLLSIVQCLNNGLARLPPMGWLSWTVFTCEINCDDHPKSCINENLYMEMADRLAEDGYLQAGYNLVNVDDCWMEMERDSSGRLVADKKRFPSGMDGLAQYIHKKGLKMGIYEDYGTKTCAGYPGSLNYLWTDASTFANWTMDMLKLDGCNADISTMPDGYPLMGEYLNRTNRPMIYSCSWPAYEVASGVTPNYTNIAKYCNLWRNYDDISLSWKSVQSIINWYDHHQDEMAAVHGPGQWNDPDMIIVGTNKLTLDQSQAQMAIWSIWSAPLLMSNDLRSIAKEYKDVLLNKKVIAVNQDPLGKYGKLIANNTDIGVYLKQCTPVDDKTGDYSYAMVIFNRNVDTVANATFKALYKVGLTSKKGYLTEDLFSGKIHGIKYPDDGISFLVNPTGVVMLKFTLTQKLSHFVKD